MSRSQSELRKILDYDPVTGHLIRKVKTSNNTKVGERAGWKTANGYRAISIFGKQHLEHRLIYLWMTGAFPQNNVDHINQIKDDNRWNNLRLATKSQNEGNTPLRKNNKSGHKCVCWDSSRSKWLVVVAKKFIGRHTNKDEAISVAKKELKKHYGEFSFEK